MGKRNKKPPLVYHDGLIPAVQDTYHSYPEVVPDDYDQVKHEKSYPELVPPPDVGPEQQQQQQQQHQQQQQQHQQVPNGQQPTILPPSSTHNAQHHHQHQQQQQHGQLGGSGVGGLPLPGPPVIPALHPLPRTSGVHSLRQAWSELDERDSDDDRRSSFGYQEDRPILWKHPILWVVAIMAAVIIVLAGLLGGVASGRIETALGSKGRSSRGSGGAAYPLRDPRCPDANNGIYISNATTTTRIFLVQCDANYPRGDGELGLLREPVHNVTSCLDACAKDNRCVGAVFAPGNPNKCWLKEFLGVVQKADEAEGLISGVLWQRLG